MENIISWVQQNGASIVATIGTIVMAASAIANLTPTKVDDNIVGKIQAFFYKVLDLLALNFTVRDKGTIEVVKKPEPPKE